MGIYRRSLIAFLKRRSIVVIFPDSGKSYLSKIFNDDWMRDHGFLEETKDSIKPLLNKKIHFITVKTSATPQQAIEIMKKYQISQLPVVEGKKVVGIITEEVLSQSLFGQEKIPLRVSEIMEEEFISLSENASISQLAQVLTKKEMVVIVDRKGKPFEVLTRIDLLTHMTNL